MIFATSYMAEFHVMMLVDPIVDLLLVVLLCYLLVKARRREAGFSDQADRLKQLAYQLEDISRQNVRLQREVNTDGLTKIGNRAHFEITFRMEWDWSLRHKSHVAMLIIDIDLFKRVNDRYGHVVGDECLVAVALAIRGCLLRSSDRVMRYGGEEFAVLLGSTDERGVERMAERILEAVRSLKFPQGFMLTVSIGGASILPEPGQKSQAFIALVDQAMYLAKDNGRNRFELSPQHKLPPAALAYKQGHR